MPCRAVAFPTPSVGWIEFANHRIELTSQTMTGSASRALPPLHSLLYRLWRQLDRRRRWQISLLFCLVLVAAVGEMVSLGAVLPFVGALTAPEQVFRYPLVRQFAGALGIEDGTALLLPLTIVFVTVVLAVGATRLLLLWANSRFSFALGVDMGVEVYRRSLYQPYLVHVARNSSTVISGILVKVDGLISGVLQPMLLLVSCVVLLAAIVSALITIDAAVAIGAGASLGVIYGLIIWFSRKRLKANGEQTSAAYTSVLKALQEGFGGIRDVLLDGTQALYSRIYSVEDRRRRRAQASNAFIVGAPRYVMEAIGMVLIAALAYTLVQSPDGAATALPVLAAFTLGAQRLLPALQQAYGAWASVVGNWAILADTLELLEQPLDTQALDHSQAPLDFRHAIEITDLHFRYQPEGPWVLRNINLSIPKGARVGIVGSTGGGKSTLLDLLMGLLEPDRGEIRIDGEPLTAANRRAWQKAIAHVPQSIFLADTTLSENIAFGLSLDAIDLNRVRDAARQAQIADTIESRAEGYQLFVGERGIRLSGGQRQRIGIARALYKRARVLVFDEATSALDNATERAVMDAVDHADRETTIIMIAHRLTTVQRCDTIIQLEQGRVVAHGSYDQLLANSQSFRSMAGTR